MNVKTLVEIPSAKGTIPAGEIIDIPEILLDRLAGKVELPISATLFKNLQHYCGRQDCLCSSRLPVNLKPTTCLNCEVRP
jgi:hypothetical protein